MNVSFNTQRITFVCKKIIKNAFCSSSLPFVVIKSEPFPFDSFPGDEAFVILSGIISRESYTVHFGQTKYSENAVIKVRYTMGFLRNVVFCQDCLAGGWIHKSTRFGRLSQVDLHPIPWDFYMNTLLRNRLGSDSTKYFSDQSGCFLYDDGCVTVSWGHYQGTLQVSALKY